MRERESKMKLICNYCQAIPEGGGEGATDDDDDDG